MTEFIIKLFPGAIKCTLGAMLGAVAYLKPTFPFAIICTLAVAYDCYTAFELSKRVKAKHPDANDGKFKSDYGKRIFKTLRHIYALILLGYLVDKEIFHFHELYLANVIAGFFCFIQFWSILENISSENNNKWAKLLQRIMVNKAERHFNIDLSKFEKENKNETK